MKNLFLSVMKSSLIIFFIISNCNAFAQDNNVKDMQANAAKDIKKEKIDSGKIWKTGSFYIKSWAR